MPSSTYFPHSCSLAHLNPSFFTLVLSHVNNPSQTCFPHCSQFSSASASYADNFHLQKNLSPHPAFSHARTDKSFASITPKRSLTDYCQLNIQIKILGFPLHKCKMNFKKSAFSNETKENKQTFFFKKPTKKKPKKNPTKTTI